MNSSSIKLTAVVHFNYYMDKTLMLLYLIGLYDETYRHLRRRNNLEISAILTLQKWHSNIVLLFSKLWLYWILIGELCYIFHIRNPLSVCRSYRNVKLSSRKQREYYCWVCLCVSLVAALSPCWKRISHSKWIVAHYDMVSCKRYLMWANQTLKYKTGRFCVDYEMLRS